MKVIRIFVVCNTPSYVPENPLLFPIQTGARNAAAKFENMLCDDIGDNISSLNPSFCELTAQYWVWKNVKSDYCGFFHNRRYLSFNDRPFEISAENEAHLMGGIDRDALKSISLDEDTMRTVIEDNDIVTVEPIKIMGWTRDGKKKSVITQYAKSKQHHEDDIDWMLAIIKEKYPEYEDDAKQYLNGSQAYFGNIYIMRKELFDLYCKWLFDILFEFDSRIDKVNASTYEMRKTGFIGERLFGIYLLHLKKLNNAIKIRHLQCVLFKNIENPYPKPAFDMNLIPVVMCSSNEYAPFTSVLLASLVKNAERKNNYDVIILDNGISSINKKLLNSMVSDYSNFSLRYVSIQNVLQNKKMPTISGFSVSTYGRLTMFEYLCNYSKVIYLDVDTVLTTDIAAIIAFDLSDYWVAAVRDPVSAGWCKMPQQNMLEHILNDIGLTNPFDYFNAGVLVLNLEWLRKVTSSKEIFNLIEKEHNWTWMDQDILNYICKGHVKFLGQEWNLMVNADTHTDINVPLEYAPKWVQDEYSVARQAPMVIHFAGKTYPSYRTGEDFSQIFWIYARKSPFYEDLVRLKTRQQEIESIKSALTFKNLYDWLFHFRIKKWIKRLLNQIAPENSHRRARISNLYHEMRRPATIPISRKGKD